MEYLFGALIAWVVISWLFFILTETGCITAFTEDKALWFLFAPMWILIIILLPISVYREKHYVLSRTQFEEIKKCKFIYRKIGKHWYLCRLYGNKARHPFLYHFIIPIYIKITN